MTSIPDIDTRDRQLPRRSRASPRSSRSGRPKTRGTPAVPIEWRSRIPKIRCGATVASSSSAATRSAPFWLANGARELDYRLVKDLWAFTDDRISVRFQYEWHDADGQWHRSYGNEQWEFDERGLMRRREASINDVPIRENDRRFVWPAPGPRPADHPGIPDVK